MVEIFLQADKVSNTFLSVLKILLFRAGIHKMDIRIADREDPDQAASSFQWLKYFLQADVSRHVEEVATDVNNLVHMLCQVCLLQQDNGHSLDTVARLQKLWRQYSTVARQGEKKSNLEEHEAMKDQVEKLLDVLKFARKMARKIENSEGIVNHNPASDSICCLLSHLLIVLGSLYCNQYEPR